MRRPDTEIECVRETPTRVRRLTYLLFGHLLLVFGVIGIVLPVLPTTVFWIGAAFFYAKSSPTLYNKLTSHERLGEPISLFVDHGVMSVRSKSAALVGMTFSGVLIAISPLNSTAIVCTILGLAIGGLYVLSRPTTIP